MSRTQLTLFIYGQTSQPIACFGSDQYAERRNKNDDPTNDWR